MNGRPDTAFRHNNGVGFRNKGRFRSSILTARLLAVYASHPLVTQRHGNTPYRPARYGLVHDLLLQRAQLEECDRLARMCQGKSYTFWQLIDTSKRLATVLHNGGLQRGDRVVLLLNSSWTSAISIFGALIAGWVFVLVNPQTKTDKSEIILRDSSARTLMSQTRLERIFASALARVDRPVGLLRVDQALNPETGSMLAEFAAAEPRTEVAQVIPLNLAAIIYTSGSTGNPKGVMQTHQSIVVSIGSIIEYLRLNRDDSILCVLPLSFDYGLYQLLITVALGARLVLERSFTFLGDLSDRIRTAKITVFHGVPTLFSHLIAAHRRAALCFPTVTRVTDTAVAFPEEFIASLREIFPNALIYKMYGLTECNRVSYLEPEVLDSRPGSVGKAISGTQVYVLASDGQRAAPG